MSWYIRSEFRGSGSVSRLINPFLSQDNTSRTQDSKRGDNKHSPGFHLRSSSVTISTPLSRFSQNSCKFSDSGSLPAMPAITTSSISTSPCCWDPENSKTSKISHREGEYMCLVSSWHVATNKHTCRRNTHTGTAHGVSYYKETSQLIKWTIKSTGTMRMRKLVLECRAQRTTSFYMTTRKWTEPLWSQQRRKINMLEQRWVEKLWNTYSKIHNYKANQTGSKTSSTIITKLNANLRINNQKVCWKEKKKHTQNPQTKKPHKTNIRPNKPKHTHTLPPPSKKTTQTH